MRGKMRKTILIILAYCLPFAVNSHTFITEILVNSNPGQYSNQYHTIQTYSFNEDDILLAYDEPIHSVSDRIRLETLKEVIPNIETIEVTTCDSPRRKGSTQKTCGQFDHFNAARSAAIKTCYTLNNSSQGLYPSGLVPRFSGPATFVNLDTAAVNHHSNYHISHGLQFSCAEVLLETLETE
jgi:hypothetical protein